MQRYNTRDKVAIHRLRHGELCEVLALRGFFKAELPSLKKPLLRGMYLLMPLMVQMLLMRLVQMRRLRLKFGQWAHLKNHWLAKMRFLHQQLQQNLQLA